MKKIFACTNGIEFFSDGESVLGTLPKEEAVDFVSDVAIDCSQAGDRIAAEAASLLLQAINKSYIQLCEIKVTIIAI